MHRRRPLLRSLTPWIVALVALPVALRLLNSDDREVGPPKMPPVLVMVQSLGELHTARYSYENVFEYETHRQPAGWFGALPGGASLVRSTTRNAALVSVQGTVEAGLDLRSARTERKATGETVVVLPSARIYDPAVRAKLHHHRVGAFWADENIALKAEQDAASRFRNAAMEQGILGKANEEARLRVGELLRNAGVQNVQVVTDSSDSAH
jgi:hypothetical protein